MESGRFTAAVLGFCVRLAMHFAWVSAALVGSFLDALGLIQLLGGLYEAVPKRYHVLLSSHLLLGIGVAGLGICGSGELQGWRVADLESCRAGELQIRAGEPQGWGVAVLLRLSLLSGYCRYLLVVGHPASGSCAGSEPLLAPSILVVPGPSMLARLLAGVRAVLGGLGYADAAPRLFGWLICVGLVDACLLSTYYAAAGVFRTGPLLRLARASPGHSGLSWAR